MSICFDWLGCKIPHAVLEIIKNSFRQETSIYGYKKKNKKPTLPTPQKVVLEILSNNYTFSSVFRPILLTESTFILKCLFLFILRT